MVWYLVKHKDNFTFTFYLVLSVRILVTADKPGRCPFLHIPINVISEAYKGRKLVS
jgi:hypothetical protein